MREAFVCECGETPMELCHQIDKETQKLLVKDSHRKNKIAVKKLGGVGDRRVLEEALAWALSAC